MLLGKLINRIDGAAHVSPAQHDRVFAAKAQAAAMENDSGALNPLGHDADERLPSSPTTIAFCPASSTRATIFGLVPSTFAKSPAKSSAASRTGPGSSLLTTMVTERSNTKSLVAWRPRCPNDPVAMPATTSVVPNL
jgi:hypothetical protein